MIPNMTGIATLCHYWILQPSFPFKKNSKDYMQLLHIPFSTFPHTQLKEINLALRLS